MLSENQLITGEVAASKEPDGVDFLIRSLYDEIMRIRWNIVQLRRDSNMKEANKMEKSVAAMQKEFDIIVKSQMGYSRYLKSVNKELSKPTSLTTVSQDLKQQKSSNGEIVQMIPNS